MCKVEQLTFAHARGHRIHEMESFLADYGLIWVGDGGGDGGSESGVTKGAGSKRGAAQDNREVLPLS